MSGRRWLRRENASFTFFPAVSGDARETGTNGIGPFSKASDGDCRGRDGVSKVEEVYSTTRGKTGELPVVMKTWRKPCGL